jgi:hypothetical protein
VKDFYWRVRGYDSTTPIFEKTVTVTWFSEGQIKQLLKALVARAGLDYSEIVGAYAKRGTKIANDHLHVHKDPAQPTYMCGSNPHFTASIVDAEGKIMVHPRLE